MTATDTLHRLLGDLAGLVEVHEYPDRIAIDIEVGLYRARRTRRDKSSAALAALALDVRLLITGLPDRVEQ